jgi:hypothetical protein
MVFQQIVATQSIDDSRQHPLWRFASSPRAPYRATTVPYSVSGVSPGLWPFHESFGGRRGFDPEGAIHGATRRRQFLGPRGNIATTALTCSAPSNKLAAASIDRRRHSRHTQQGATVMTFLFGKWLKDRCISVAGPASALLGRLARLLTYLERRRRCPGTFAAARRRLLRV